MAKIADYFLDKDNHKHYYVKIKNKNKKPVTFSFVMPDFNFDSFKGEYTYELFKMEILCANPLNLFKRLLNLYMDDTVRNNFWCLKKGYTQYIGISFKKFLEMINKKKGFTFCYPLIHENYYLIFNGISKKPESFKLFIYFNNHISPYIDLIDFFQKEIKDLNLEIKLKTIKKIKVPERPFYALENECPKLICTLGYIVWGRYVEFYYFIKRPKTKTNTFVDDLSHLIVWNNEEPIKYKEKQKFLFCQTDSLDLDELFIFSLRTSKCRNDNLI